MRSGYSCRWSKRQKCIFQRLTSWCKYKIYNNEQLLRVDLTSSLVSDPSKLKIHFDHLRKKVEREYSYKIDYFKVHTSEGNGVLHMIWSIKSEQAVYISQKWLSAAWLSIHGASVVWIQRIKRSKFDVRRVSAYCCNQYLAGQSAIVRVSYSWRRFAFAIGRAWKDFKILFRKLSPAREMCGESLCLDSVGYIDMLRCWDELLKKRVAHLQNLVIYVEGRELGWYSI